ncbi:Glucokinase [Colletotrichum spinosum]|uniref:Glucokinase n=1 Tax=Colletotrichum spinosum TaxID=1347390 RepID=A0A4V3HSI2_9PEZI|nr:Glucokinase [Colletotrichum spinosum]
MSPTKEDDRVSNLISQARKIAQEFEFPAEDVRRATAHFLKQLNEGLEKDGTFMCQIPSYVTKLPNGSEKGVCLAIDLGGTNLRVTIPRPLMSAPTYKDLFRFIALQMRQFMEKHHAADVEIWTRLLREGTITDDIRRRHLKSLGFTFSFTFDQHALDRGELLYWTKSFDIPDAVGRDPCAMLQEALDEQRLPLLVTALANDTVGTLAARAYTSPGRSSTVVGAIFGTGTNGAYMERISRITKLRSGQAYLAEDPDAVMALNTEWGGFDNKLEVLPTTRFDKELDEQSVNPDDQHFEKRISGMYLGELLRRILVHLRQVDSRIFDMKVAEESLLYVSDSIDSSLLSLAVKDRSPDRDATRLAVSKVLGVKDVSETDARAIQILSEAIGRRAARLSSVAIAGVALQSGRLSATLATASKPVNVSWGVGLNILTPIFYGVQSLWNLVARWLHVTTQTTSVTMQFSALLSILAGAGLTSAHMVMTDPAPLRSKTNPNTSPGSADYSYSSPLSAGGSDYPCKGYLGLLGTSEAAPVAEWNAGGKYSVSISSGASHGGGSCQISLSFDGGKTFKVIHSYVGGCPTEGGGDLGFTLPADTPSSDEAVLAWSWFNKVGNREMYMNCAVIKVSGGSGGGDFDSRPDIFRANTNGCRTVDSKDVMFPNPGPDVDLNSADAVPPTGDCGSGSGSGSGGGSGGGSGAGNPGSGSGSGSGSPGSGWLWVWFWFSRLWLWVWFWFSRLWLWVWFWVSRLWLWLGLWLWIWIWLGLCTLCLCWQ